MHDSPSPAPGRVWVAFSAVVLLALALSGVAVLILVIADGDLSAPLSSGPGRSIGPNPPLWVGWAFAVGSAIVTWVYAAVLLRRALRTHSTRRRR